jgi:hypothetical protein
MTFTPAEIAAADDAFRGHREGRCPDDCGFCYDLLLAGEPKYERELKRITDIKAFARAKAPASTKGKGSAPVLVPPTKAPPEWTLRQKPKERKSKARRR